MYRIKTSLLKPLFVGLLVVVLANLLCTLSGCSQNNQPAETSDAQPPFLASQVEPSPTALPTPKPDDGVWAIMQFLHEPKNAKKFAFYKKDAGGGVTAVFHRGGTKYGMYFSGPMDDGVWPSDKAFLSYWVTAKSKPRETFSCNYSGKVWFGIIADKSVEPNKLFRDQPDSPQLGEDHRGYWQDQLNHAVDVTLHHIGRDDLIPPSLF